MVPKTTASDPWSYSIVVDSSTKNSDREWHRITICYLQTISKRTYGATRMTVQEYHMHLLDVCCVDDPKAVCKYIHYEMVYTS